MKWDERIAIALGSHHSDTMAVVRWGKRLAKRATNRRNRRMTKKLYEREGGES